MFQLRELVNPSEQYALRDTLSSIIEEQYKDNVISSDDVAVLPAYTHYLPTINQINQNYSDLLFQGDIRIPTKMLRNILDDANGRHKRTAFRNGLYPSTIWKKGVPYAFHKSMNNEGKRSVLAAIQFWRKHTCIRFRRRTKEQVYLLFVGNDDGCWSTVGRDAAQGQQLVSIGRGCEAVSPKQMKMYGTPYDIGSVMQYTPFEFSIDPRIPSMVAVNINEQGSMGQLAGPSYLDIQIMNAHYACGCKSI
ncbi:astacin [Necator americanus]|uniref:Astacin n=1 Tax=Necator americanus TaxID=51031 RepID=W2T3M4_NECAM|nr:astacin [Necator americanus]ETN75816.1 astacin [Necator americanus]